VFARTLAVGEIAVGTMLLLPIVPPFIAGTALVGFSGAQLNMYRDTPGMHYEGRLRLTPEGTPISETVWMFGIGVGLMTDATFEGARKGVEEIEASVARRRVEWGKRARRRVRRAQTTGAESVEHLTQRAKRRVRRDTQGAGRDPRRVRAGGGREGPRRGRGGFGRPRWSTGRWRPRGPHCGRGFGGPRWVRGGGREGPHRAGRFGGPRWSMGRWRPRGHTRPGEAVRRRPPRWSTGRWRPRPTPRVRRFGGPRWSTGRWRPRRPRRGEAVRHAVAYDGG
jgi:hypothetical protein